MQIDVLKPETMVILMKIELFCGTSHTPNRTTQPEALPLEALLVAWIAAGQSSMHNFRSILHNAAGVRKARVLVLI